MKNSLIYKGLKVPEELNVYFWPEPSTTSNLSMFEGSNYAHSSELSLVGATSKGSDEPVHYNRSTVQSLYNTSHYNTDLNKTVMLWLQVSLPWSFYKGCYRKMTMNIISL